MSAVVNPEEPQGVYRLPVVGQPLYRVHNFYEQLEPTEDDSRGSAAGKHVLRFGTVAAAGVAATAVAAIVVL